MLVGDVGRIPATLLLFAEEGRWKWCLSDRETSSVAFHACEDPLAGLKVFEAILAEGRAVWRQKKEYSPKRG